MPRYGGRRIFWVSPETKVGVEDVLLVQPDQHVHAPQAGLNISVGYRIEKVSRQSEVGRLGVSIGLI